MSVEWSPETKAAWYKMMAPANLVDSFAEAVRSYYEAHGWGRPDHKEKYNKMNNLRSEVIRAITAK